MEAALTQSYLLKRVTSLENKQKYLYKEHIIQLIQIVEKEIKDRGGVVENSVSGEDEAPESRQRGGGGEANRRVDVGGVENDEGSFQLETQSITPFVCIKNVYRHGASWS